MKFTINVRAGLALAGVVLLAMAAQGCRPPKEKTPEGTLSLLRDSLTTGRPPIDRVADTRIYHEAAFLYAARRIQMQAGIPLSPTGVQSARSDITTRADPRTAFAGVLTLLRQGHCEKIGDARVPEVLSRPPQADPGWPRVALELQESVARRLTETTAGDYRCDGGPSFRAVFVRPDPNDGTWRVAQIGPAGRP